MITILIANRGEIAIRIAQAVAEMGLRSVAAFSEDDSQALHTRLADEAIALPGQGPGAYLDIAAVIDAARRSGCGAIHPGYGFLSESADFAQAVEDAGLVFIGPTPAVLRRLGNKIAARDMARELGVPVNDGLPADASIDEISAFMASLNGAPIVLKAVAGGGGRGMRVVRQTGELMEALDAAQREAEAAFGIGDVYAERFMGEARHIEVQIVGDGEAVVHVWERDCTLQRRHQKLIEIAPAPALDSKMRQLLLEASVRMAKAVGYRGLGTFEFLLGKDGNLAFIEANPRLQVEHTITEAVTGLDLVQIQIGIALGACLADLGLEQAAIGPPIGSAVQARVNLERMDADGNATPTGGVLRAYETPGGTGVRVDGHGFVGQMTSPHYDSLLAKVIAHAPNGLSDAIGRVQRALRTFRIEGAETNIPYLLSALDLPEIVDGTAHTEILGAQAGALHAAAQTVSRASGQVSVDPLAILTHGQSGFGKDDTDGVADQTGALRAPMQGTILAIKAEVGDAVRKGAVLFVMEAMKMQHAIAADHSGKVRAIAVPVGQTVYEGDVLAVVEPQP